jgi:lipoprotein NlpI
MNVWLGIVALLFSYHVSAAETPPRELLWQKHLSDARDAWRTNSALALTICDRAIATADTNAAPWMMRAAIYDSRREYDKALKDVSEALRLQPRLMDAWQLRGTINFKLLRFTESVQDFDRFLAYAPSQRPYHWQRGISLYYAGKYEEGRKQFELHESVNRNDVENAGWHFLCVARASSVERARATMLKPGTDSRVPMMEIYALFAGKGSAEKVMAAANSRHSDDALFYAHLYLALYYDVLKDPARAKEHIAKAVEINPNHYMGDVARVHAKLLKSR